MQKNRCWGITWAIGLLGLCITTPVMADSQWEPVSVNLDCQSHGRTKVCPAFLRSFIDESPVLSASPRSGADVILRVNVTETANVDQILLSFSSDQENLPSSYEVKTKVDSRQSDDEVRAAIEPSFNRGIAVFVGQRIPESVQVTLAAPKNGTVKEVDKSPWGFYLWLGGDGNWSKTRKNGNSWGGIGFRQTTKTNQAGMRIEGNYGLAHEPPITDSHGEKIPMQFEHHGLRARGLGEVHLDDHWSTGLFLRAGHEDPEGRYKFTARAHTGISYDLFPSDDPRGNRLSVAYLVGYQADQYNHKNDMGDMKARFPTHALLSEIGVRHGTQTYRFRASVAAQILAPQTRYVVDVSPEVQFQLGNYVDLNLNFGITQQKVPGPHYIPPQDYERLQRSSYSDPLRMRGSLNLLIHFDPTNGERNDRWEVVNRLGEVGSL